MRIAITGATGFLGRHLVEYLLEQGHSIRALLSSGELNQDIHEGKSPEWVEGNLANSNGEAEVLLGDSEVFIHLAACGVQSHARDWPTMGRVNTLQPLRWLHEARRCGVGKVLVAGTALEYAGQGGLDETQDSCDYPEHPKLDELSPLESTDGYGATKAAGGILQRAYAREYDLQLLYLRMATIYGPGDDEQKFFPTAQRLADSRMPLPMTGGEQVRDWLHVSDAVAAISAAIDSGETIPGDVFNIGTGAGVRLKDLAKSIYKSRGADTDLIKLGRLPYRKLEKRFLVLDIRKAKAVLGWEAVRTTPYPDLGG